MGRSPRTTIGEFAEDSLAIVASFASKLCYVKSCSIGVLAQRILEMKQKGLRDEEPAPS